MLTMDIISFIICLVVGFLISYYFFSRCLLRHKAEFSNMMTDDAVNRKLIILCVLMGFATYGIYKFIDLIIISTTTVCYRL
jgi:hypothetical protein